ncbi:hypothetical protein PPTG_24482 [Phytophthora nicotianae INRA-310]|uniref:Uncharacterized protein n=1 Tax=Phytophthora nicotianae (strain INRA-310) TaxID=761204 RepID=W2PGI2_PHYN3|nr:hypothetical protein PPTG_24482 [Phytophthora nicotianae INRA-310]ETM99119.1 hypothetical protein PPTG_24482 [Phytophthora nicotianae INRA-310]
MSIHSDDYVIIMDDDVLTYAPPSTMSLRTGSGHIPSISPRSQLSLYHISLNLSRGPQNDVQHQRLPIIKPVMVSGHSSANERAVARLGLMGQQKTEVGMLPERLMKYSSADVQNLYYMYKKAFAK